MEKIRPLHDRLMVEKIERENKTEGGIIIPDSAKEKPMQARVVAVGEGVRNNEGKLIPMSVKKGDMVLFAKWGGEEIKLSGKEYLILKESDVLCILE